MEAELHCANVPIVPTMCLIYRDWAVRIISGFLPAIGPGLGPRYIEN